MTHKILPVQDVPEVAEYAAARAMLDALMGKHPQIFEEFHKQCEQVNIKRQAADKAVRAKGVTCGPWEISSTQTTFNATALYEALGRKEFLEVGGKLTTQTVYDLDKNKVKSAISSKKIPKNVADVVVTVSPKYTSPKEIKV